MPEEETTDKRTRGLYEKFRVERTDGRDKAGEKHEGCVYFVLDVTHDPYAILALISYARACQNDFPALSKDVEALAREAQLRAGNKRPGITRSEVKW